MCCGKLYLDSNNQDFDVEKMSASTSPHKEAAGWVKFDESEVGEVDGAAPSSEETINSPTKTKTSRSSSGVSSARGSVQSVVNTDESGGPASAAVLSVSEVVDRKKLDTVTSVTSEVPMFRQMSSSRSSSQMDEVNLDGQSPRTTNDHIRGRRFRKFILKCIKDKFVKMSI